MTIVKKNLPGREFSEQTNFNYVSKLWVYHLPFSEGRLVKKCQKYSVFIKNMNGKIYELLKKINDLKIEKFGIQRENRMFLKRLLLDDEFLDEFIRKSGGDDVVIGFLTEVYNNLSNIGKNLDELVEICDKKEELKEILGSDIRSGIKEVEEKKDILLDKLIKTEINEREEERRKIDDEKASSDRYNDILNKIKNED